MDNRLREVEITLAGIAQRVQDHGTTLATYASLSAQLHEITWKLEDLKGDVDTAHGMIRALEETIANRRQELEEAQEARNQQIAEIEADRRKDFLAMQQRQDSMRLENRRILYGLIGIFLTAAATVLVPLLNGGGG